MKTMSLYSEIWRRMQRCEAPFGFCLPRSAKEPPAGPEWIHEIKHDGVRIIARRHGPSVRLVNRSGRNLTHRFPLIVSALAALPVTSFLIDGEAIVSDYNGLAVFELIRNYRRGNSATLCAFDILELKGEDLRDWPVEDRKAVLKMLLRQAKHPGIAFNRHFDVEGAIVFYHACKRGCEGIVSKRFGSNYRSGQSDDWIKVSNLGSPAVRREAEGATGRKWTTASDLSQNSWTTE
jgi:bifunctional non-homologous end joining protein LigD